MNNKKMAAPGERAASKTSTVSVASPRGLSRATTSDILDPRISAIVRKKLGLVVETPPVKEPRSSVVENYLQRRKLELAGGGK